MTDEQFEKLLTIEAAKLAMLQNIAANLQVLSAGAGKAVAFDWKEVAQHLKYAASAISHL